MTSYRSIAASELDHKSPITETLMTALADNPLAITEGASGAPRIVSGALDTSTTTASVVVPGTSGVTYLTLGAYAFFPAVGTMPSDYNCGLGSDVTESVDSPRLRIVNAGSTGATVNVAWRRIDA